MKRFVQIKKPQTSPQTSSIVRETIRYSPIILHATVDQAQPVGHKRTFVEHAHNLYHIAIYTKGDGEYSVEGRFHPAPPGTCVLIHPGQRHDFASHWRDSVYSEITFAYESPESKPLCISFEELLSLHTGVDISLLDNIVLPTDQMYVLRNLLMMATDHLNSADPLSQYHGQHDLMTIFNFLIGAAVSAEHEMFSQTRFERVKAYIEEHYSEHISIDELAKMASLSKGYFFREFKKQFGVSPLAHQQLIRIEAAKTLLKTTTLRCNEIAWQVGFSDVYFFHRIFKKHIGLTPIQFRKTN